MTVRFAAPGRINLIGEHTDYNLGFALPIALPAAHHGVLSPPATAMRLPSAVIARTAPCAFRSTPHPVTPTLHEGWAGYMAGVMWALREAGHPVPGGAMSITSEVAMGSGLSSSAALECAALGAIASAADVHIDRKEQARLAQRAENEYVGAPTGLLDQLASLFGEPATALLIDFR